jgi:hypothetical protein
VRKWPRIHQVLVLNRWRSPSQVSLIAADRALAAELHLRACADLPLAGTLLAAAPALHCPQVP